MVVPYKHEPFTDFTVEENKNEMLEALKLVEADLGKEYPLIIGGERVTTEEKIVSVNPANKEEVIGYVSKADQELAERAMQVADETFKTWRKSEPEFCARILFRDAPIVHRRKSDFSAHLDKEGGTPWKEADADVAAGIDLLEYYGRQMLELKDGVPINSSPIEYNQFHYIPLGVGLVISPWNFLFAIMAGTTVAAMVTGNTVLLKPASTTQVIDYILRE